MADQTCNAFGNSLWIDRHARPLLLVILLIAAALRLPLLSEFPPPLNQDEASRGYDAWALLETGADRHGQSWPFFLESFGPGDYTAALSTYITIPFVALLGPTPTAMRLPGALLGVATVGLLYFWLSKYQGKAVAILAAGILATDPWHVMLSRTAQEAGFAPFFLAAAMLGLHRAGLLPNGPPKETVSKPGLWAAAAGLMLAGHAWVYPATRLFTPLFVILLAILARKKWVSLARSRRGPITIACLIGGLMLGGAPIWITAIRHPEQLAARAGVTLIFNRPVSVVEMAMQSVSNFASNLDPRYLFIQCDDISAIAVPGVGQHLPVLAPFCVAGLFGLVKHYRASPWSRLMIGWLILYPIPAAICADWNPHPFRTVGGMLWFPIVTAMGVTAALNAANRWTRSSLRLASGLAGALMLVNLVHGGYSYVCRFPPIAAGNYQTSLIRAIEVAAKHSADAEFVLVTNQANQPYIFALLFQPISPQELAESPPVMCDDRLGFRHVLRVGKYLFPPSDPVAHPEAARFIRQTLTGLSPGARGLVIERVGRFKGGEVIARVAGVVGEPSETDHEVLWWQPDAPVKGLE